ncbi:MAG: hypothetical protein IT361_10885 [Gemmatimonadaceae bacterium]|nr:hypothetical protein [Gemmatimonadaceae bacterium]
MLTLFGVPLLALFVWSYAAMTFTYSSGHRAGVLMKLSKKGWICKTWEGELQVAPVPGSLPVTFPFTVRNDRTAAAIGQLIGRQVELTYEEHKGVILSCFGETQYYGVGARPIQQP